MIFEVVYTRLCLNERVYFVFDYSTDLDGIGIRKSAQKLWYLILLRINNGEYLTKYKEK